MKCKNTKGGVKCGEVYAEEEGIKRTYLCEKHNGIQTTNKDLILTEDTTFNEDLKVNGNIKGDYNLTVKGNIKCRDIDCININCYNIDCYNIDCYNIDCYNIDCSDIDCYNINCYNIDCSDINCSDIDCINIDCINIDCGDINYYAVCFARKTFKCISVKGRRYNSKHFCLDSEIIYKNKVCDKCGSELK